MFPVVQIAPSRIDTAYVTRHDKYVDAGWSSLATLTSRANPTATAQVFYTVQMCPTVSAVTSHTLANPQPLSHVGLAVAPSTLYRIQRRFEDFVAFSNALSVQIRKEFNSQQMAAIGRLPVLPRRRIFISAAVCDERVVQLDKYVKELFMLPPVVIQMAVVVEFFGIWKSDLNPRRDSEQVKAMLARKEAVSALTQIMPRATRADSLKRAASTNTHRSLGRSGSGSGADTNHISDAANPLLRVNSRPSIDNRPDISPPYYEDVPLDEEWLRPIVEKRLSQLTLLRSVPGILPDSIPKPVIKPSLHKTIAEETIHADYGNFSIDSVLDSYVSKPAQSNYRSDDTYHDMSHQPNIPADSYPYISPQLSYQPSPIATQESYRQFVTTLALKLGIETHNTFLDPANDNHSSSTLRLALATTRSSPTAIKGVHHSVNLNSTLPSGTLTDLDKQTHPAMASQSLGRPVANMTTYPTKFHARDILSPSIPSRGNSRNWKEGSPAKAFEENAMYSSYQTTRTYPNTLKFNYESVMSPDSLPLPSPRSKSHDHSLSSPTDYPFSSGRTIPNRLQLHTPPTHMDSAALSPRSSSSLSSLKSTLSLLRSRKAASDENLSYGRISAGDTHTNKPLQLSYDVERSAYEKRQEIEFNDAFRYPTDQGSIRRDDGNRAISILIKNLSMKRSNKGPIPDSEIQPNILSPFGEIDLPNRAADQDSSRKATLPRKSSLRRLASPENNSTRLAEPIPASVTRITEPGNPISTLVRNLSIKKNKWSPWVGPLSDPAAPLPTLSRDASVTTIVNDDSVAPWNRIPTPLPQPKGTLLRTLSLGRRKKSNNDMKSGATSNSQPATESIPIDLQASSALANTMNADLGADGDATFGIQIGNKESALVGSRAKVIKLKVSFGEGLKSSSDHGPYRFNDDDLSTFNSANPMPVLRKGSLRRNPTTQAQLEKGRTHTRFDAVDDRIPHSSSHHAKRFSAKLFRSHTLSSGTSGAEVERHFIQIRAIADASVVVSLKLSRTVDFTAVLDKLAMRFATHENTLAEWKRFPGHFGKQIVAIQSITYKDSDSHLINIQDEEDWLLCLDEAIRRGKLTLFVSIESINYVEF
ncbi:hypothetical protein BASA81_012661 [Batrachochytrium salamandrivorans]|nr:hypothetical protein BASA81_012661 [Batrachochytrium salamandrivorans]